MTETGARRIAVWMALLALWEIALAQSSAKAELQAGEQLLETGDVEGALLRFLEAQKLDPHLAPAFFKGGVAHYLKGEWPLAQKSLEQAVRLSPKSSEYHYRLAQVHLVLGHVNQLFAELETASKLDSKNRRLQKMLAQLYSQNNRQPDAIRLYRRILKESPTDTEARFRLHMALFLGGELEDSYKEIRQAYQQDPQAADGLFYREIAWAEYSPGLCAMADKLKAKMGLPPDGPRTHWLMAQALISYQRFESAAEELLQYVEAQPDPMGHLELGKILAMQGAYAQALREYSAARELGGVGIELDLLEAEAGIRSGNLQRARELLTKPPEPETRSADWYRLTGELEAAEGKFGDAANSVKKAIALDPNRPRLYYRLATFLRQDGRLDEAVVVTRQHDQVKRAAEVRKTLAPP